MANFIQLYKQNFIINSDKITDIKANNSKIIFDLKNHNSEEVDYGNIETAIDAWLQIKKDLGVQIDGKIDNYVEVINANALVNLVQVSNIKLVDKTLTVTFNNTKSFQHTYTSVEEGQKAYDWIQKAMKLN